MLPLYVDVCLDVNFIYLFMQQMQYNTHVLNTIIKRKVKTTCNLKYNMANDLRSYSLFDSCT